MHTQKTFLRLTFACALPKGSLALATFSQAKSQQKYGWGLNWIEVY
jgi:hypothetical protein